MGKQCVLLKHIKNLLSIGKMLLNRCALRYRNHKQIKTGNNEKKMDLNSRQSPPFSISSIHKVGQDKATFVDEGRGLCFLYRMSFLSLTEVTFPEYPSPYFSCLFFLRNCDLL